MATAAASASASTTTTTTTTTEPPRSTAGGGGGGGGGSADSYIGSLISLTSKSEIRYEGVLYNINTQDSTIGLTNVRSFGTEGRKKDGPQVPPSDKVYEFILFRGSDIKDLQVKSSPPVQTMPSIQADPAIIQSHYPQAASMPSSLPSTATGSLTDPSSHSSPLGLPRPTFQGSNPLYQPGGMGSWGSPSLPPSTSNMNAFALPMYWQGYYPSNVLQTQQQTLLRPPPPGLSIPPSMPQPMQHPPMNPSPFLASPLLENQPPSAAPFSTGSLNLQSSMLPALSSGIVSDPANLIANKTSSQAPPTASLSSNLPLASPVISASDISAIATSSSEKPKALAESVVPFKSMPEPLSSISGTSNAIFNGGATPSLVTPGQFLQPGATTAPPLQSSQTSQKDVEVVQVPSPESPPPLHPPSTASASEVQEPILPLPSLPERKLRPGYSYHGYRGRERGRGSSISRAATRYTEEFDFTAMNEKFNKDEIWGSLGKSNKALEDGDDSHDEDNAGASKSEATPVYVKDDFFDSLSCDALDVGSRNGRPRHSEQYRKDSETFGDFSRHRGGRGGWGPGRGGRSHGGVYHGRSYGYGGRGRGYGYSYGRSSHGI